MLSKEPFRLSEESKDKLLRLLQSAVSPNGDRGGAIFRIESLRDGLLWEGAAGKASFGGPSITPRDAFEVASITKMLTAACVLLLYEAGRVDLDAPLANYLGVARLSGLLSVDGEDHSKRITVRHALGHRSGLADYWSDGLSHRDRENEFTTQFEADPERVWQPDELLAYVRRMEPIAVPGKKYHYSDTNYVLLGLLLEELTKKPLASVFRERLLDPLGMHDTYLSYRESSPNHVVESHRYEKRHDLFARTHQSADWAGGGIVSTTADLIRFMTALESGRLFRKPTTFREMQRWSDTDVAGVDYGLGMFKVVLPGHKGHLEGHDGHGNSWLYYWPRRKIVFAGTLNQTDNDWWPLLRKAIAVLDRELAE